MTNRTREIFDFAQLEPVAMADFRMMLDECDEEEIGHVEMVAENLLRAIREKDDRILELDDYGKSD